MYSYEDRIRAVELYIKLGKRVRPTIRQLGYPTKNSLKGWYNEYQQKLDLPAGYAGRRPKFSQEQKATAIEHYLTHDRCIAATMRALGYPCRGTLTAWIREALPEARRAIVGSTVDAMERLGHLDLDPVVKSKVLQVSASTIDRVLADARSHIDGKCRRRAGVGAAIRRSIPVRTFADWRDPAPGFFEIDMVEHCGGPKTDGDYVHTLTLTDIASGWTECVAMRVRDQMLVIEAFEKAAAVLPFAMLGIDSDNDSTFMSQAVFDYCKGRGLEQTRSRPYKKNDQAWVEQKNGAIVRRLVGYGRLSGREATTAMARLYESSRLYINFFQPSFKLKSKTRDGARVHKVYFAPATPCERLVANEKRIKISLGSLSPIEYRVSLGLAA